jgi:phosphoenolpyruvate carboxykinase (ATP)
VYARMLAAKLDEHGAPVWLLNTGWTGGPFGVGERMPIAATRALLSAALSGELAGAEFRTDQLFGFEVPVSVPGVDTSILDPRGTWSNPADYDALAAKLVYLFVENFAQFADQVDEGVRQAAPRHAQQQAQPSQVTAA